MSRFPAYVMSASLRRTMPVIVGGWALFGLLQAMIALGLAGAPTSQWGLTILFHFIVAMFWAATTFAVIALRRSWQRRLASANARVAAHLPTLVAAALLYAWVRREAVTLLAGSSASLPPFIVTALYYADLAVVSYAAIVIIAQVVDAQDALVARERRALALREQLTRAQLDFLEGQLQPHFLFNALSTIAELAHEAPAAAVIMLRDLSRLLRSAVASRGRETVTLAEELELLEPYLGIQRVRFEDWLRIDMFIDVEARDALVPRLVLQPLVENAVRHGLADRSAPGRIAIRATVKNGRLTLAVEDNGAGVRPGAAAAPGHGAGLRNIRERLRAVHGDAAVLELREAPSGGAVARITIPLAHAGTAALVARPPAHDAADEPPSSFVEQFGQRRIPEWAAIAGVWSLAALFWIQQSIAYTVIRGRLGQVNLVDAARRDASAALTWALVTPLVLWLARRFPVVRARLGLSLAVHVIVGALFVVGVTSIARVLGGGDEEPLITSLYQNSYISNAAIYAIIVCVAHTRRLHEWIKERELATGRLQAVLQASRLQHLTAELRPGVVLATLDHLADVAMRDPRRTERIVARLGALLRATLDGMATPRSSLASEVHALIAYVDVLAAAVVPGLQLVVSGADAHADVDIPSGLLRSLLDELLEVWKPRGGVLRLTLSASETELVVHASSGARPMHVNRDEELVHTPRLAELVREGALLDASVAADHADFTILLDRPLAATAASEPAALLALT